MLLRINTTLPVVGSHALMPRHDYAAGVKWPESVECAESAPSSFDFAARSRKHILYFLGYEEAFALFPLPMRHTRDTGPLRAIRPQMHAMLTSRARVDDRRDFRGKMVLMKPIDSRI